MQRSVLCHLQRESIMKAEALISVIPLVTNNDTIDGYILMYYSVSHIRDLFTRSMPYDNTFMLFSVDDGLIITMKGLNEKPPVNVCYCLHGLTKRKQLWKGIQSLKH